MMLRYAVGRVMCLENDLKISSQYNIRLYVSYLYASRYGFGDNA